LEQLFYNLKLYEYIGHGDVDLKNEKWTKEKMGPYGWTLLHLIAAKLPSELTEEEIHKFKIFMHLL
jgi:hypothetical protein